MTTVSANYALTEQVPFPEIYKFQVGTTIERYTSWDTDLTVSGQIYTSAPIKRSSFKQDTQMGKATVDVSATVVPVTLSYISNAPIDPLTVVITRVVLDDLTQQVVIFTGESTGITFKDRTVTVKFESTSGILNTMLPKWICKPQCNHVLFDSFCGVLKATYTLESTVTLIDVDGALTISGLAASGFTFVTGYVEIGTSKRLIVAQAADKIYLHAPFYEVSVGSAAVVIAGCDGDVSTCLSTYNNLDRFLGMLTIPTRNPTVYGVA